MYLSFWTQVANINKGAMAPRIGDLGFGEWEGGPSRIYAGKEKGMSGYIESQIIGYVFQNLYLNGKVSQK